MLPMYYPRLHHPWTLRFLPLSVPLYPFNHQSLCRLLQKLQDLIMKLCISLWLCRQRKLRRSVCRGLLAHPPHPNHRELRQRIVLQPLVPHPLSLIYRNVPTRPLMYFHGRVSGTCQSRLSWNLDIPATLPVHLQRHLYLLARAGLVPQHHPFT